MAAQDHESKSEWVGLRGRVMGWYLGSSLRRAAEVLFLGDSRGRFLREVDQLLKGDELVLDVGGGSGYFSLAIAERLRGGKLFCIDLSPEMLRHLRRKAERQNLADRVEAKLGNAYELPLEDSTIDLATSNGVFHELARPARALLEIRRVLKPGGRVIITDFRNTSLGKKIAIAHRDGSHGPFSEEELRSLLADTGFSDVKTVPIRNFVLAAGQRGIP